MPNTFSEIVGNQESKQVLTDITNNFNNAVYITAEQNTAPTENDNDYATGSLWLTKENRAYICMNNSDKATWGHMLITGISTGPGGSGTLQDGDVIVDDGIKYKQINNSLYQIGTIAEKVELARFDEAGLKTWKVPEGIEDIDIFIGGGGSGGTGYDGGVGGCCHLVTNIPVTGGSSLNIHVGRGGQGNASCSNIVDGSETTQGGDSFVTHTDNTVNIAFASGGGRPLKTEGSSMLAVGSFPRFEVNSVDRYIGRIELNKVSTAITTQTEFTPRSCGTWGRMTGERYLTYTYNLSYDNQALVLPRIGTAGSTSTTTEQSDSNRAPIDMTYWNPYDKRWYGCAGGSMPTSDMSTSTNIAFAPGLGGGQGNFNFNVGTPSITEFTPTTDGALE